MIKMLFNIALIALIGYVIYVKFFKKRSEKPKQEDTRFKKSGDTIMIACDKCGTFIGSEESIAKDGKFYCSKECGGVKI